MISRNIIRKTLLALVDFTSKFVLLSKILSSLSFLVEYSHTICNHLILLARTHCPARGHSNCYGRKSKQKIPSPGSQQVKM